MNQYPVSTQARIKGSFLGIGAGSGQVDPTTVTLTLTDPYGNQSVLTTPTVIRDGVGVYHYDLTINIPGTYAYRWQGTGAVIAASNTGYLVGTLS